MHFRKIERNLLKRKLEAGISINMPAPRRIGKTWTINQLALDLVSDGWTAVEIDVEGMHQPEQFARAICKQIEGQLSIASTVKTHFTQRIQNLLGGNWAGSPLEALGSVDAIEFLDALISALNDTNNKSAILVDEIAYFFLRCAEKDQEVAYHFAYRLRGIQQKYKNVRWLLTGSIGLNVVAKRYELDGAFVDFESVALEPFTNEEAMSFLRDPTIQAQLNQMFDASDEDFDWMFKEIGWLAPYCLKLVANETKPSRFNEDGSVPTAIIEDFKNAFAKLLGPGRCGEFAVWKEHVRKNLPATERELALVVLDCLSKKADGEKLDTLLSIAVETNAGTTRKKLKSVVHILMTDGLLEARAERYFFRSGLIRQYWKEYEAE
ncbi:MAG: hypothetical protein GY761_19095 [Hyphomicrobiales bacterium]|nr:hypothetical protein [Hyphomicrobiales bacterium]